MSNNQTPGTTSTATTATTTLTTTTTTATTATTATDADAPTMTIGELSDLTGLSPSAIRFYQRRGLLPERENSSGWQRFGSDTLGRLAIIELAKSAGFTLDEIVRIFDALNTDPDIVPSDTPIWHGLAEAKIADVELRIQRLEHMHRILKGALNASYLSPDRVREASSAIGWTMEQPGEPVELPHHVDLPTSAKDLDTVCEISDAPRTPASTRR